MSGDSGVSFDTDGLIAFLVIAVGFGLYFLLVSCCMIQECVKQFKQQDSNQRHCPYCYRQENVGTNHPLDAVSICPLHSPGNGSLNLQVRSNLPEYPSVEEIQVPPPIYTSKVEQL